MLSKPAIDLLTKGVDQLAASFKTIHRAMKLISENPKKEEEAPPPPETKPAKRFECKPCGYQSNHKGDYTKHCDTLKHKKTVEPEPEPEPAKDPFEKMRKQYKALADEKNVYRLTAAAFLEPLRMGSSGRQGMCCRPMSYLWDAIHKHLFGGGFYMTASKNQIYNKTLPRTDFTFEVFEKMIDAANLVNDEANYIIERRERHLKYYHNKLNWKAYDIAMAYHPRYTKDKRPDQKRINIQSLHEYLMTCR